MNVFADPQTDTRPSTPGQQPAWPALITFSLCLIVGLTVVVWRGRSSARAAALTLARAEVLARGATLESQLNQAVAAAEVLGALARQSGGTMVNFQQVATELFAAHPGLATLELQPGGVVSDIVPRAGHERAIGVNVLNDPVQRQAANVAIQRRALTVTGPIVLSPGEPGIVVRVPIFQRGRDGREYFWGLVAVSMRLSEALARAKVDALAAQGYGYALLPPASAGQKAGTLVGRGMVSWQDAVRQIVQVQDLRFQLALQPPRSRMNWTKVVLESLGVLLAAGLLAWLAGLAAERGRLNKTLLGAEQADQSLQARLDAAERQAGESESRARAADETAAARQADLELARKALQEAKQKAASLEAQLEKARRAESESAVVAQKRLEQHRAAVAELEGRLASTTTAAKEAAKDSAARLKQAQESNQELRERLQAAEPAQARVAELAHLLEAAQAELEQERQASASRAEPLPVNQADAAPARSVQTPDSNQSAVPQDTPAAAADEQVPPEPVAPVSVATRAEAEPEAPLTPDSPPTRGAGVPPGGTPALPPESQSKPMPEDASPTPKPLPKEKPPKSSRRRSGRRDNQMDLFAEPQAAPAAEEAQPAEKTAPETADKEPAPARRLPSPPPVNPAQLRKAVNEILPLLTDGDPGAKDCLKANRTAFRSAFSPEGYVEFEQLIKDGNASAALEHLRKAARKNGISI